MHYTFQLPEFLVQNSLSAPAQVFQECWSEPPPPPPHADLDRSWHFGLSWSGPPPPPKNEDLDRSWHFGLSWSGPPLPPYADLDRSWHFGLSWSGPPPPPQFRFGQILALWDYVGTGVWRLIAVSRKDTVSLKLHIS